MEVTPARNSVGLPIEREDTKEFLSIVEESVVEDASKRISLDEAPEVLGCYNICGHPRDPSAGDTVGPTFRKGDFTERFEDS